MYRGKVFLAASVIISASVEFASAAPKNNYQATILVSNEADRPPAQQQPETSSSTGCGVSASATAPAPARLTPSISPRGRTKRRTATSARSKSRNENVLADQVKRLDWRARKAELTARLPSVVSTGMLDK